MASITLTDPRPRLAGPFLALALVTAGLAFGLHGVEGSGRTAVPVVDGEHRGRLSGVDPSGVVTFDAAELVVSEGGARIRDARREPTPLRLAPGASVFLFECSSACRLAEVDRSAFLAGDAGAAHGDETLYGVRVDDGQITRIVEVYIPGRRG